MRYRFLILLFAVCVVVPALAVPAPQDESWDLMTKKEMGVDRFAAEYPDFDGKGVVIAVLDTGVDMGVAGLRELPGGGVKVVDCRDFSGEGDVIWEEGTVAPDGDSGEKLVDSKGRSLRGFREKAEGAVDGRLFMAFLEEEKFEDTSVKDLNADGDSKDSFGFLVFAVREEKKEGEEGGETKGGELRYAAVVDLNGDGNLDDGVLVTDYYRNHETFVFKGKEGARQKLTMALNFYPEEKRLSVHFDDGAHGTHVAGIAAGYSVHGQEGYNGMAPGAKVISLKIGNNRFAGGCTTTESMVKAYEYGAEYSKKHKVPVIFNMSYGIGSEIEGRSAIDRFMDDFLWKNPGVVVVTSAGNEGPGLSTVGTPAASKRAVAVGALLSPAAAAAQYGAPGLEKEVLFGFSSRGGDTYKPDIVAPGSACSTVPLWADGDHMHGTSMASPAATGAVALLVDGLVRHDPPFEVDNALVLRALKNSGRALDGWSLLDVGGGALDLPAAYELAVALCGRDEGKVLREYRITNRGPAPGEGAAYWRASPYVPSAVQVMSFEIEAGFPADIKDEEKARFYRAFDLEPDVEWLSLNKPIAYLKGSQSANVGVMADLEGREPGLYTGRILAREKGAGGDAPCEFALPVSVLVAHRVTPENKGQIRMAGEVAPGFLERYFVEVPSGTTAVGAEIRILDGDETARVSLSACDPDGVGRGFAGASGGGSRQGTMSLTGEAVVPGTWEFVVSGSIRAQAPASFDLVVSLNGVEIGGPDLIFGADTARRHVLVPVRCTQAAPFNGTLSGRLDGCVKREVVVVEDAGEFTRTVSLDSSIKSATWTVEFDRETYGLFTDCVLQIRDAETGKTIRNTALGQRSESVSLSVPKDQKDSKEYALVLIPAFTRKADSKKWRFVLTERLAWSAGVVELEPVSPRGGRLSLLPWDWAVAEFTLSGPAPAAPAGYALEGVLEAGSRDSGTIARKRFTW